MRTSTATRLAIGAIGLAAAMAAAAGYLARRTPEPASIFLAPNADIAAKVDVDDPAHFLGEPFAVDIVVQYRPAAVRVEPDSLRRLSFAPFEPTGVTLLKIRQIDGGITEYRYSSEIRAIELDPGKAYKVAPGTLVYERPAQNAKESLTVDFEEELQVSSYYGDRATRTPYRPLRGALPGGRLYARLLQATAGLLVAAVALLGVRWGRDALDWSGATPEEIELRRLHGALTRFGDRAWVAEVEPRTRLKQLESIAVHASPILMGRPPHALWNGHGDDAWARVSRAMSIVYGPAEPDYEQVEEGRQALAEAFGPVLRRTGR
ncbi:MAG: hypothetical protein IT176_14925 [Acidobacteria bacterium]|nr:hypothetical protein [Acidobacteriota bacterium]